MLLYTPIPYQLTSCSPVDQLFTIGQLVNWWTRLWYSQQDKSQNEDSSFSITENMKNISVLDDILDCDYDSEIEEDEDEKDDSNSNMTLMIILNQ